ncbi:MAG: hypothetical protein U9N02_04610, partial [Campylobacterota bacterium]|nr:hypothetical protein [Campylobacterota bacterium]
MLILAIFAIINFFANDYRLKILNNHGKIINISGKQRMISQKSLLLTYRYLQKNQKYTLVELEKVLKIMQESNEFLSSNLLTK